MKHLRILSVFLMSVTIFGCGEAQRSETPPIIQVETETEVVESVECQLFSACRDWCDTNILGWMDAEREACFSAKIIPCQAGACWVWPEELKGKSWLD